MRMGGPATLGLAILLLSVAVRPAAAQVDGHVSLMLDVIPDVDDAAGAQTVTEARLRIFVERQQDLGPRLRLNLAAHVDGLAAGRRDGVSPRRVADAVARPLEAYAEFTADRFDIRAGASRLIWGRLDEIQPTDVVNPIDLSRFLLEGRNEARLPVGLVRGRVFLSGSTTIEAVVVPLFRAARVDQLGEDSSPFDLRPAPGIPRDRDEPATAFGNVQGGGRLVATTARVDWGLSVFRGFRAVPAQKVATSAGGPSGPRIIESFPRFTMIGGEFETAHGPWGLRGELAVFVEDALQASGALVSVPGRSIEGGIGLDRRAGDYRVAGNVLWSWRRADASRPAALAADEGLGGSDLMFVVAANRSFARETRTLQVFAVYDPADATAFGRVVAAVSLRDNLWLEASGGIFAGSSPDTLGRLTRRDFLYARLKTYF